MNVIGIDTSNYTTSIACFDGIGNGGRRCRKRLCLNQTCELILRKAVDIGSSCNVSNYPRACVSLGNAFDRSVDDDAGVSFFESFDLLLGQSGDTVQLGDPQGHIVGTGQVSIVAAAGLGIFLAAGEEAQAHSENQCEGDNLLHTFPPYNFA